MDLRENNLTVSEGTEEELQSYLRGQKGDVSIKKKLGAETERSFGEKYRLCNFSVRCTNALKR